LALLLDVTQELAKLLRLLLELFPGPRKLLLQLRGIVDQLLHRHLDTGMPILTRSPRRRPHRLPIGCTINRAPEAFAFDERFQQHHRMPVLGVPVLSNPADHLSQDPTAQSRHLYPRKRESLRS